MITNSNGGPNATATHGASLGVFDLAPQAVVNRGRPASEATARPKKPVDPASAVLSPKSVWSKALLETALESRVLTSPRRGHVSHPSDAARTPSKPQAPRPVSSRVRDADDSTAFASLLDAVTSVIDRATASSGGATLSTAVVALARHVRGYYRDLDADSAFAVTGAGDLQPMDVLVRICEWLAAQHSGATAAVRDRAQRTAHGLAASIFCLVDGNASQTRALSGWIDAVFAGHAVWSGDAAIAVASGRTLLIRDPPRRWAPMAQEALTAARELREQLDGIEDTHGRELAAETAVARYWQRYNLRRVMRAWRHVLVDERAERQRQRTELLAARATEQLRLRITERDAKIDELNTQLRGFQCTSDAAKQRMADEWERDKQRKDDLQAEVVTLQLRVRKLDDEKLTLRAKCIFLQSELERTLTEAKKLATAATVGRQQIPVTLSARDVSPIPPISPTAEAASPLLPSNVPLVTRPDTGSPEMVIAGSALFEAARDMLDEFVDALQRDMAVQWIGKGIALVEGTAALEVDDIARLRQLPVRQRVPLLLASSFAAAGAAGDNTDTSGEITAICVDEGLPEATGSAHCEVENWNAQSCDAATAMQSIHRLCDYTALANAPFLVERKEPRNLAALRRRLRECAKVLSFVETVRQKTADALLRDAVNAAMNSPHESHQRTPRSPSM
jgi:hypothetical protein